MPSTTIDQNGVLYAAWNDRPAGVGGDNANATRIFLSFSLDGNKTWSTPQQISASPNTVTMNDRFQPWITTDSTGLHAMWYERVPGTTVDLIQTNKEDLSLATAKAGPKSAGEVKLSTVAFPIVQTNPQQDPVISFCYMGDYNNVASNGTTRFVTWGDNRNVVTTSAGVTENQPDVFLQSYYTRGGEATTWWPPLLSDGVERQILSANLAREGQRLACRLLTWSPAGLVAKRRQTRTITFMHQAGRAVLRPQLFAMLPGERAHAGADAMLTLLQLSLATHDGRLLRVTQRGHRK